MRGGVTEKEIRKMAAAENPAGGGRLLPCSTEEAPTAEIVARAIVASANVLKGNPLEIEHAYGARWRFPALAALAIIYPGCPFDALGRMVGIQESAKQRLNSAKRATWWAFEADAAIEAALEALEAA